MNKTIYFSGAPYVIKYQNIKYRGPYFHRHALEIMFVISGDIQIDIEGKEFSLKEGEFIGINAGLTHMIRGNENTFVSSLYFNLEYFKKKYPYIRGINFYCKYNECNSTDVEQYHALRNYFIRLMIIEYLKVPEQNAIGEDICNNILNILIDYIYDEVYIKNRLSDLKPQDRERILRITKYNAENYHTKGFSMIEVAEHEHLSPTRLSHFWKSMINISFMDVVAMGRFMEAKRLLMEGEISIGMIVKKCGFSDEKYLYKMIRDQYGMTPMEFRKKHQEIISKPEECRVLDITEIQNEIIQYSSKYYLKLKDFSYLGKDSDRTEEEKHINSLYSIIIATNKKIINNEDLDSNQVILELGLGNGLRYTGSEFIIDWEYIYAISQITIVLYTNCSILLHIELMSVEEWHETLKKINSKVYDLLGNDFKISVSLIVAYKESKNYYKAKNLVEIVNNNCDFASAESILNI